MNGEYSMLVLKDAVYRTIRQLYIEEGGIAEFYTSGIHEAFDSWADGLRVVRLQGDSATISHVDSEAAVYCGVLSGDTVFNAITEMNDSTRIRVLDSVFNIMTTRSCRSFETVHFSDGRCNLTVFKLNKAS